MTPLLWVVSKIVVPRSFTFFKISIISWVFKGSKLPVGSSAIMMSGWLTMARAIATRWRSPPESSCGKFHILSPRSTSSSTCGTSEAMCSSGLPETSMAKATFSYAVLWGSKRKSWKTIPTLLRKRETSRGCNEWMSVDSKKTVPEEGLSSTRSILRSVVFPAPDWPTIERNSPGTTEKLMSSSAMTLPGYIFETLSKWIIC